MRAADLDTVVGSAARSRGMFKRPMCAVGGPAPGEAAGGGARIPDPGLRPTGRR
jgi:hypothetical protein